MVRTEQDVELLETSFRADTDNSIYTRICFSYEKKDKFGNRQKAVTLFTQQCRSIFICTENCLSGIINFFVFKKAFKTFFIFYSADLLYEPVDEVIWLNSPSYAQLFFRDCFFTRAQQIVWNYQNAYQEKEVILGIVKMYHDVSDG